MNKKYNQIYKSNLASLELNVALLYGISFETIEKYAKFMLNPTDIVRISKMPCIPPTYKRTARGQLYISENEIYEASLNTGEKVICEYLQKEIESGEIRACVIIGQKETPLPIPYDNFFTLKSKYEEANINSQ